MGRRGNSYDFLEWREPENATISLMTEIVDDNIIEITYDEETACAMARLWCESVWEAKYTSRVRRHKEDLFNNYVARHFHHALTNTHPTDYGFKMSTLEQHWYRCECDGTIHTDCKNIQEYLVRQVLKFLKEPYIREEWEEIAIEEAYERDRKPVPFTMPFEEKKTVTPEVAPESEEEKSMTVTSVTCHNTEEKEVRLPEDKRSLIEPYVADLLLSESDKEYLYQCLAEMQENKRIVITKRRLETTLGAEAIKRQCALIYKELVDEHKNPLLDRSMFAWFFHILFEKKLNNQKPISIYNALS